MGNLTMSWVAILSSAEDLKVGKIMTVLENNHHDVGR